MTLVFGENHPSNTAFRAGERLSCDLEPHQP
jgi:hypothetical protein